MNLFRKPVLALFAAFVLPGPAFSADAPSLAQLAKAKNCMACHLVDSKIVGPAFKDVAARYRGNPEAPAQLAKHIRYGSKDVWGSVPMPSNNQVTDEEARALAAWVLSK